MSRLIDADALIEAMTEVYKKNYAGDVSASGFTIAMEMVRKQPTAYDIEKVVAELEYEANLQEYLRQNAHNRSNIEQAHIHRYAEQCYRNKAIDIVRKGGAI